MSQVRKPVLIDYKTNQPTTSGAVGGVRIDATPGEGVRGMTMDTVGMDPSPTPTLFLPRKPREQRRQDHRRRDGTRPFA